MNINNDSALIIIDMQRDFCAGGALEVAGGEEIIPTINRLSPRFPLVVATRDWHPAGHISFASAHPGKAEGDTVSTPDGEQLLWPDHCIAGGEGADFHPRLGLAALSMILHKGANARRDSYSAFCESDGKSQTGLAAYLRARGVATVYMCGLATEFCVMRTALDAVAHSFRAIVVTDAIVAMNTPPGSERQALRHMEAGGVGFCASAELLAL